MTGFAYHRPKTLDEALELRARHDLQVLAGGTDFYPNWTTREAWGESARASVLDIGGLTALRGIAEEDTHWRIGALTTWTDILRADLPGAFDALKLAARELGGVQIQNRGTVAGNICNASPAADGTPCLLAMDAQVEIAGPKGTRTVALAGFHDGYRSHVCGADELVTAILVPRLPGPARSHFLKLGARRYLVISIVMAAGVLVPDGDGRVADARIAVGACSESPKRLAVLEERLHGARLEPDIGACVEESDFTALSPIGDMRASADYRAAAARVLVRDLLERLAAPEGAG